MKKYSLKRLLLEVEGELESNNSQVINTPPREPSPNIRTNLFTDGTGVEFPQNYVPDFIESTGTHDGNTVITVTLPPKTGDAKIETVKDNKKALIKAVDLSEVLLALYFQGKGFNDVSIQGSKSPFDVAYGSTRWEVKTLEVSAARLGKHGKVAFASRLREFSLFRDSFEKMLNVLNEVEDIAALGLNNLKTRVEKILEIFEDRTSSGELPASKFGTVAKPKQSTKKGVTTIKKGQVTEFAKSLVQIRRTMLRMDCDLSEVSITIPVNGQPMDVSLSRLAKTKKGDLFELIMSILAPEQAEVMQRHMTACKLMAAAHEFLMLEDFEELKNKLANMTIISARYESGPLGKKRRKDIASAILNDYFAQQPPIHGFCFVKGVGIKSDISFGSTVELHLLDHAQCLLAIEKGELVFESVSVMAPKIYYKGWGIAEQDDENDVELQRSASNVEENVEEVLELNGALDDAENEEVPETELEDIPDITQVEESKTPSIDNLLTERQKRFWAWSME